MDLLLLWRQKAVGIYCYSGLVWAFAVTVVTVVALLQLNPSCYGSALSKTEVNNKIILVFIDNSDTAQF